MIGRRKKKLPKNANKQNKKVCPPQKKKQQQQPKHTFYKVFQQTCGLGLQNVKVLLHKCIRVLGAESVFKAVIRGGCLLEEIQ